MRLAARLVLVAAFLLAQAAGASHDIWHAGTADATHAGLGGKAPAQNPLCDFHAALGAVLDALDCAAPQLAPEASPHGAAAAPHTPAAEASFLAPLSRGPPALV